MKIKHVIQCLASVLICSLAVGCTDPDGPNKKFKAMGQVYFGDKVYFENSKSEVHIDELGITSTNGLLSSDTYTFSFDGEQTFAVKDNKNHIVSSIKGTNVSSYNTVEINNLETHFYEVQSDDYLIHVTTGDEGGYDYSFALVVPATMNHGIKVVFENTTIDNYGLCPIISSYSYYAVNVEVKGENNLNSGTPIRPRSDFKLIDWAEVSCVAVYATYDYFSIQLGAGLLFGQLDAMSIYMAANGSFTVSNYIRQAMERIAAFAKDVVDFYKLYEHATKGEDGPKGFDGIPAFSAIGLLTISGDGTLSLSGGNGGPGGDAPQALISPTRGGDGGDATYTIIASKLLISYEGNYTFNKGVGGFGGRNSSSYIGNNPMFQTANDGQNAERAIMTDFTYEVGRRGY